MMPEERTWMLLARVFGREASVPELAELETLLKVHPELYFPVQVVTGLQQKEPLSDLRSLEQAYRHHLSRMADAGIRFPAGAINTPFSLPSPSRSLPLFVPAVFLAAVIAAIYFFRLAARIRYAPIHPPVSIINQCG